MHTRPVTQGGNSRSMLLDRNPFPAASTGLALALQSQRSAAVYASGANSTAVTPSSRVPVGAALSYVSPHASLRDFNTPVQFPQHSDSPASADHPTRHVSIHRSPSRLLQALNPIAAPHQQQLPSPMQAIDSQHQPQRIHRRFFSNATAGFLGSIRDELKRADDQLATPQQQRQRMTSLLQSIDVYGAVNHGDTTAIEVAPSVLESARYGAGREDTYHVFDAVSRPRMSASGSRSISDDSLNTSMSWEAAVQSTQSSDASIPSVATPFVSFYSQGMVTPSVNAFSVPSASSSNTAVESATSAVSAKSPLNYQTNAKSVC